MYCLLYLWQSSLWCWFERHFFKHLTFKECAIYSFSYFGTSNRDAPKGKFAYFYDIKVKKLSHFETTHIWLAFLAFYCCPTQLPKNWKSKKLSFCNSLHFYLSCLFDLKFAIYANCSIKYLHLQFGVLTLHIFLNIILTKWPSRLISQLSQNVHTCPTKYRQSYQLVQTLRWYLKYHADLFPCMLTCFTLIHHIRTHIEAKLTCFTKIAKGSQMVPKFVRHCTNTPNSLSTEKQGSVLSNIAPILKFSKIIFGSFYVALTNKHFEISFCWFSTKPHIVGCSIFI